MSQGKEQNALYMTVVDKTVINEVLVDGDMTPQQIDLFWCSLEITQESVSLARVIQLSARIIAGDLMK